MAVMAIAFITFTKNGDHKENVWELQTKTMESDNYFLCNKTSLWSINLKSSIVVIFTNNVPFMIFTQNSDHNGSV